MNRFAIFGLSSVFALGACAQPEATVDQSASAAGMEAEASLRTVQVKVTGMR